MKSEERNMAYLQKDPLSDPFIKKIYNNIKKHNLINDRAYIIVALSGGPDSVALLLALYALQEKMETTIEAIHINHNLRDDAVRDETFSKEFAKQLGVGYTSHSIDIEAVASEKKVTIEEAGRLVRYFYFTRAAHHAEQIKDYNQTRILTGHHQDDNAETMLLNLTRGTGLTGLTGIPLQRDRVVRPLLFVTKDEILAFLETHKTEYVIDHTNKQAIYDRNIIRLEVMPILEKLNPQISESLLETREILDMDDAFIEKQVKVVREKLVMKSDKGTFIYENLERYDRAIRARVIKDVLEDAGLHHISKTHIEDTESLLAKQTGKKIHLPNLWAIRESVGILICAPIEKPKDIWYDLKSESFTYIEEEDIWVWYSEIGEIPPAELVEKKEEVATYYLSARADKKEPVVVRRRKDKDWVLLHGGRKTLSRFLIDEQIPFYERDDLLFVASESQILGVMNNRVQSSVKKDSNRQEVVQTWEEF